jgi:hypothetical protein
VQIQYGELLAEAKKRSGQAVELSRGGEIIHPPQGAENLLFDFLALAVVLGDLKVAVAAGRLDANEHARTLPGTPLYYTIFDSLSIS